MTARRFGKEQLDEWLTNCLIALLGVVPEIPEDGFTSRLSDWYKGSKADLGGWLFRTPYFKDRYLLRYSRERLVSTKDDSISLGKLIFGTSMMFDGMSADYRRRFNERTEVELRLQDQILRILRWQASIEATDDTVDLTGPKTDSSPTKDTAINQKEIIERVLGGLSLSLEKGGFTEPNERTIKLLYEGTVLSKVSFDVVQRGEYEG